MCDNAGDEATRRVCDEYASRMRLEYLVETAPGKNSALNAGLQVASGELLLFTDDDVFVDAEWMATAWTAANEYPDHNVFGGPIIPDWPDDFPAYLRESRYRGVCFSILDRDRDTGPELGFFPFGTNLGVRRSVFDSGVRYNTEVGPSQKSYIMGSETSLVRELADRGEVPVYVNDCSVIHRIRPEQASLQWLLNRGVKYGRMLAYRDAVAARALGEPQVFPRWLIRQLASRSAAAGLRLMTGDRKAGFEAAFEGAIALGKLRQHREGR